MGGFRQELNQDSVMQSLADEGTVCRKSSNLYSLMFLKIHTCYEQRNQDSGDLGNDVRRV